MKILRFILFLKIFIKLSTAINVQCQFLTVEFTYGSYRCSVLNNLDITWQANSIIDSITGNHKNLKGNADVDSFWVEDKNTQYFPTGLERHFPNIREISISLGRLKEIHQSDLRPFSQLISLSLIENDIQVLEEGLFDYNKELSTLWFDYNKIFQIHHKVFDNLPHLHDINLFDNTCISDYSRGIAGKIQLVEKIKHQCPNPNPTPQVFSLKPPDSNPFVTPYEDLKIPEVLKYQITDEYRPEQIFSIPTIPPVIRPQQSSIQQTALLGDTGACGKPQIGQGYIIGGERIIPNAFPWIAALLRNRIDYFCGGTLVSDRKVVTAAHCIEEKQTGIRLLERNITVLLGMHNLNESYENGRESIAVWRIHLPDKWNPYSKRFDSDIALLILDETVRFSNKIQPICLINPATPVASKNDGFVVGYGKSEDPTTEHELTPKWVHTPIQTDKDCAVRHSKLSEISGYTTFCAGTGNGIGVCHGDSGGGLVVTDGNSYYLRGIVSSSLIVPNAFKCDVNSYALYTDALQFNDWINSIMP